MDKFQKFYKTLSLQELKILMATGKLSESDLYDFMIGYTRYLQHQKHLDE